MRAWSWVLSVAVAGACALLPGPASAAERCGPRSCAEGEFCCNDSCGLCAPPGGACIQPYCGWGPDSVAGRRPILALDHPNALMGPRVGAMAGLGWGSEYDGGQLRAAGLMPFADAFRARGAIDASLASLATATPGLGQTIVGRDGAVQSELGLAWNVPTSLTWLQAALMVDGVSVHRRSFQTAPNTQTQRSWALADLELAPGIAVTAQRWSVAVSAYARAGLQLSCEGLDCVDQAIRLWDMGISLDADGRNLGIPVGLMVRGRTAAGGDDLGAGVFWLGQRLRVGLELRAFVNNGELSASWPDAEWNVRVDWLGAER
jgi:hypothetical protein